MRFTNTWFESRRCYWDTYPYKPKRILEIGCYEGASACHFLKRFKPELMVCVDEWKDYDALPGVNMEWVKERFAANVQECVADTSLIAAIMKSTPALASLIVNQMWFDLIYVDGAHDSQTVIADAVMAFNLLTVGGVIAFDDYKWSEGKDSPQAAIDAFMNIFSDRIEVLLKEDMQVWCKKLR